MKSPLTVAHEIRYPWPWPKHRLTQGAHPDNPFYKARRNVLVTIWHHDPSDYDDCTCDWRLPRKLTEYQEGVVEGMAQWEQKYPFFSDRPLTLSISDSYTLLLLFARRYWWQTRGKDLPESFAWRALHLVMPSDGGGSYPMFQGHTPEQIKADFLFLARTVEFVNRPWWKHPRWHVRHWRFQVHPLQGLRQRIFDRCKVCGCRFRRNDSRHSSVWDRPTVKGWARLAFWRSTTDIAHDRCLGISTGVSASCQTPTVAKSAGFQSGPCQ